MYQSYQISTVLTVLLYNNVRAGSFGNTTAVTNAESRLTKNLLKEYELRGKYGRPIDDVTSAIRVNFGLTLLQIMDLDEKNQVLTLSVWDHYEWNDTYLSWDPEEYDDVVSIRLPYKQLWLPDITLYNYADERLQDHRDSLANVFHTGLVKWNPQAMYKSSCKIEIARFPFDTQSCLLKFGSWSYSAEMMDVFFLDDRESFDMTQYITNNEWHVVRNYAKKQEQNYTCCNESFQDLTFWLELRRMSELYNYILVIPCVLLSSLTLVLFWIPPQSPAKIQLGINIFVAFFVMMLILEESIPTAADSVPMIGKFYLMNMILITLSSFLTVSVANIAMSTDGRPVPRMAKKIFVDILGKLLCVRRKESAPFPDQQSVYVESNGVNLANLQVKNPTLILKPSCKLEEDVNEINAHVKKFSERSKERLWNAKKAQEWSIVASVVDRFLFAVYLIVIMCSILLLFPLESRDNH